MPYILPYTTKFILNDNIRTSMTLYDLMWSFIPFCNLPCLTVDVYVYSRYTAKLWQNLNTPLDPYHPYGTRIVSWTITCHTCNIYLGYHQHLHQEGKFYTGHYLIVRPRPRLYGPPPVYIISTIYMLPIALVPLPKIHPFLSFLFLRRNRQDFGQKVSNIMFYLKKPTFHILAADSSQTAWQQIPKYLLDNFW